jgi:hypothetical protein
MMRNLKKRVAVIQVLMSMMMMEAMTTAQVELEEIATMTSLEGTAFLTSDPQLR